MKGTALQFLSLFLFSSQQASGFVVRRRTLSQPTTTITRNNNNRPPNNGKRQISPFSSPGLSLASSNNDGDKENSGSNNKNNKLPFDFRYLRGPIILCLLSLNAAVNLVRTDLPPILSGRPEADYFRAIFDTVFLGWAGTSLLLQTGILEDDTVDDDGGIPLGGLECRINVDVGREPGTWMDKDWAASGARLILPVGVRFTNERVDLGIPGESGLGRRYCRRLEVIEGDAVSFVGPRGTVTVPVKDGAWSTLPILTEETESQGARKLRFFLEFPDGARRNDVSIPAGRVFFSSAVFPPGSASANAGVVRSPGGASILPEGGVTIKDGGGILNLWGAAGDINLILGRYSVRERTT